MLTPGLRLDDHSDFGLNWSPSLNASQTLGEYFTVKAGIARAFKAPNLYQSNPNYLLYTRGNGCPIQTSSGGCYLVGNENLDAETSVNKELGIEFRRDGWVAGLTYFRNDYKNKIVAPLDVMGQTGTGNNILQWSNAKKAVVEGLEGNLLVPLHEDLSWSTNLTYMLQSKDKDTGNPLSVIPEYTLNSTLDWQASERLSTQLTSTIYGRQEPPKHGTSRNTPVVSRKRWVPMASGRQRRLHLQREPERTGRGKQPLRQAPVPPGQLLRRRRGNLQRAGSRLLRFDDHLVLIAAANVLSPAGATPVGPFFGVGQASAVQRQVFSSDASGHRIACRFGGLSAESACMTGYCGARVRPQFPGIMLSLYRQCRTSASMTVQYPTIADCVGNTPLVRLQRLPGETSNTLLVKLEGNNPAGSVKDRPALSMISRAELRGDIRPGDTLIEATSGNTGIALAMAAAIKGYKMILIMPDNSTAERKAAMTAYGAELILVSKEEGMEGARDLADKLQREGRGKVLDQFANGDNPEAHYHSTGPEIWQQTGGSITHFVSSMGTTGTIMGVSRYLKEQNPAVQIVGLQPMEGSAIPGIRRWPQEYLPKIYDASRVDRVVDMHQDEAEDIMRRLAREEGIFCGVSSGGAVAAMLRLSRELENAVLVAIICDRGDRYLSSGVYDPR